MADEAARPIINTWDQLRAAVAAGVIPKTQAVGISYRVGHPRDPWPSQWIVFSPFFSTNPAATPPVKAFTPWGSPHSPAKERKESARLAAIEWASSSYDVHQWVRNRSRDYVPAAVEQRFPIPRGA